MNDDEYNNPPVTTGWLTTQLSGDKDRADGYKHLARKLMAELRIHHGVNDRIAQDQPGGFFKKIVALEDGSRITLVTNNGNDMIQINVPEGALEKPFKPDELRGEAESIAVALPHLSVVVDGEAGFTEQYRYREVEEEKKTKEQKQEPTPYMWVGIRVKQEAASPWSVSPGYTYPTMPAWAILSYMVEPYVKDRPRGIVGNNQYVDWAMGVYTNLGAENPTLSRTLDAAIAAFHDNWSHNRWSTVPIALPDGIHNLLFSDEGDTTQYSGFNFSINGLRCYDSGNKAYYSVDNPPPEDASEFVPYDPKLAPDKQDSKRTFNDDAYGDENSIYKRGRLPWDVVYVIDPEEDMQTDPCDPRKRNSAARRLLEKNGMAAGLSTVLSGSYVLHIGAYSDLIGYHITDRPTEYTDVSITGLGSTWRRRDDADYMEHLFFPYAPLQLEIEVRLNKEPMTETTNYEVTIERYAALDMNVFPYGTTYPGSGCPGYNGPNPRGPNWAGFDLIIDVQGGSVSTGLSDEAGIFTPGAETKEWVEPYQDVDIYVYTGSGISYGTSNAVDYTALAIYCLLERMTTGYYDYNHRIYQRTQADIAAAITAAYSGFGTPSQSPNLQISLYDSKTNTFTPLERLPDLPAVPDGGSELLMWFYPYAFISKSQCRLPFAIITEGPTIDTGIYHIDGEPDIGLTCC